MNSGGNEPRTRRDWIDHRRKELRLTLDELATAMGRKRETLRLILNGSNQPTLKTIERLEDALQWKSGSWEAIGRGDPPTPLPAIDVRTASLDDLVDTFADMADHLTDAELMEAVGRVLRIRQKRRSEAGQQSD